MRIGIDFDNTLACYDHVFTRLAQEWGLIGLDESNSKQGIRELTRQKMNGELLWQRLQGEVYGQRMPEAEQFVGEDQFLRRCAATSDVQICIVSHKTEFGHFDETRTNLRDAAYRWMCDKGFFDPTKYAIPEKNLFFESTQQEKVARIASLQCDFFIDDLVELFSTPSFPRATKKILFANGQTKCATPEDETRYARFPHLNPLPPAGEEAIESLRDFHVNADPCELTGHADYICTCWPEIEAIVFGS